MIGDWFIGDWFIGDWFIGDWFIGDWFIGLYFFEFTVVEVLNLDDGFKPNYQSPINQLPINK